MTSKRINFLARYTTRVKYESIDVLLKQYTNISIRIASKLNSDYYGEDHDYFFIRNLSECIIKHHIIGEEIKRRCKQ